MKPPVKTIGIVAPSSPVEPNRFSKGLAVLKQTGFAVKVFGDPTKFYGVNHGGFSSDSVGARVAALKAAFADASVDAVLVAKGGYGSLELLPQLPLNEMVAANKPIIGFSDATALLVAVVNHGGYAIHGPTLESGWGRDQDNELAERSAAELVSLLRDSTIGTSIAATVIRGASVTTTTGIVGGNLMMLASLCGTPWQPKAGGKFLFIEEVAERPYRIHRAIVQMKLSGVFEGCLGLLLGHFTQCSHEHGLTAIESILDALGDSSLPVAIGIPSGHELLNIAVPFGVGVRIALTAE